MESHDACSCSEPVVNKGQIDEDALIKASLGKIKNRLLIMSGKGGVGKTSVSVNLSLALANQGYKVGLMDVDIHGPDIPRMLGLKGMAESNTLQKLVPMRYYDNLHVISIESIMQNKDDAIIWRGPMKHAVIRQFIADVDWGELDYLIIDAPPGTGDEPLSVAQTITDAKAIIITTPQEISLADVRKSISFCRTVKMEILGLIENMSSLTCPHCQKMIDLFGTGGGKTVAKASKLDFMGSIPFDSNMVKCGDAGTSFLKNHADSKVTKAFLEISKKIIKSKTKDKTKTKDKNNKKEIKKMNNTMKFAIPLASGKLTAHFGHCEEFALIDVNEKQIKNKETLKPPPHEPGLLPKWLHEQGVNVVIAGGMGNRAIQLFGEQNIKVITGAPSLLPEELVNSYLSDSLETGSNVCDH
jgi:Mrp family chromosome partitioning ATPase/predicted Fe-Mo cluster-binding NifX family protein